MLDKAITEFDKILKNLLVLPKSIRQHPDQDIKNDKLSNDEKKHTIGLMRVNHCGEICAQGLYQGQALSTKNVNNRSAFDKAASEEIEHLAWTQHRIEELGGKVSLLNPIFYLSSILIGAGASLIGDKWSMGFLKETELQVEQHLNEQLSKLPKKDLKSKAIFEQMQLDERNHAQMAEDNGALELPKIIKIIMQMSAKIMTKTTYYI